MDSDYRDYQASYLAAVQARIAAGGTIPDNRTIEKSLISSDATLIVRGGASVGKSSDGLAAFVNPSDAANLTSILGTGASIDRFGSVSDDSGGQVGGIDLRGAGTFTYSLPAEEGDSGGGYVITQNGNGYVFGVQSANSVVNNIPQYAIGTYFTLSEWAYLNDRILFGQVGNLTATEPVNLLVGSTNGETLTGSGRADIILGRDGNDTVNGEFTIGAVYVWGDDLLYGGAGDDTINAYRGNDILHGGDRSLTVSQPSVLEADGSDTADYTPLTELDATKGVAIQVTDQAVNAVLAANVDASFGTYVTDRGRGGDVDLLISVEKVTATSADDVLVIIKLDSTRLAGADKTGGLYSVDLAGQAGGDLIDLSAAAVPRDSPSGYFVRSGGTQPLLYALDTPDLKLVVTDAEKILGSSGDDTINGSAGADTIAGGDGNDTLSGGGGDDILFSGKFRNDAAKSEDTVSGGNGADTLVVEAGGFARLEGGAGADKFFLSLDLQVQEGVRSGANIVDSETQDSLFWHGYQLTGGSAIHVDYERKGPGQYHAQFQLGYTDTHGVVYYWFQDNPTFLQIGTPDGRFISVSNWTQGKLGISLTGQTFAWDQTIPVADTYGSPYPNVPKSNISYSGEFLDLANLSGAASARETPGPNAEPVPPTPYTSGSSSFTAQPEFEGAERLGRDWPGALAHLSAMHWEIGGIGVDLV